LAAHRVSCMVRGQITDIIQMTEVYQILMAVRQSRTITVGRLGIFHFPKGFYVYTGSGGRAPDKRIARHLRRSKRHHWHIDYLRYVAEVQGFRRGLADECATAQSMFALPGAIVVARRFGASDCHCKSHLAFFRRLPPRLEPEFTPL
jgi:Uri superfamily endonuclease